MNKRAAFFLIAAFAMSAPVVAQEEPPVPLDALGEEVFGDGYLPSAAPDIGDYFLATPRAGMPVSPSLLFLPQRAFRDIDLRSLPADRLQLPNLNQFNVPLRKDLLPPTVLEQLSRAPRIQVQNLPPDVSFSAAPGPGRMFVHYVDVGQGAGAILEFSCGVIVVDAGGGGGVNGDQMFADYLASFFATRPYLDNTINTIFLSHPHADHIDGVDLVLPRSGDGTFKILNVVDDGLEGDRASLKKQTEFKTRAKAAGAGYTGVLVEEQYTLTGVTSGAVDPLSCEDVDPVITAFWGGLPDRAGQGEYKDINNHSVVVRVDFGLASFLFVGDLEDQGARDMLELYSGNPGVFDADVYLVSHHGAAQETTDLMLQEISPKIAVISMGTPEESKTVEYGHPRLATLAALQEDPSIVSEPHPAGDHLQLGSPGADDDFIEAPISKAIYGTGWVGTVVIEATSAGEYDVGALGRN